uniref:Uncharacterized protein n=1 Tax=Plectus sambesii TaxID=2011161 RepID=A0A914VL66_9BILA
MIFFVWSLVLSAVNFARRQKMAQILSRHFTSRFASESNLVFRRLNPKMPGLAKMSSEPIIGAANSLLYRTETFDITARLAPHCLNPADWCLTGKNGEQYLDASKYVAFIGLVREDFAQPDHPELDTVQIGTLCKALAWRKGRPWEILFTCELDDFYAVACAWSERVLRHTDSGDVKELQKTLKLAQRPIGVVVYKTITHHSPVSRTRVQFPLRAAPHPTKVLIPPWVGEMVAAMLRWFPLSHHPGDRHATADRMFYSRYHKAGF